MRNGTVIGIKCGMDMGNIMWSACGNKILFKTLSLPFASAYARHTVLYKCCHVFKMGFSWLVPPPPPPPPHTNIVIQTLLKSLQHVRLNRVWVILPSKQCTEKIWNIEFTICFNLPHLLRRKP